MDIFIVTLEPQEISRLIMEAEGKIEHFEQRVQNISFDLETLKKKREAVLAALEFAKREERRRTLTDMFVKDGEYGLPINFSANLLNEIERRRNELDQRIRSYENKREERQNGIEFMRDDIELLRKIQQLDLIGDLYEKAAVIND